MLFLVSPSVSLVISKSAKSRSCLHRTCSDLHLSCSLFHPGLRGSNDSKQTADAIFCGSLREQHVAGIVATCVLRFEGVSIFIVGGVQEYLQENIKCDCNDFVTSETQEKRLSRQKATTPAYYLEVSKVSHAG